MNCQEFEDLLFAGLAAPAGPSGRAQMSAHVQSCARCRGLASLVSAEATTETAAASGDLVEAVLMRTSGKPCTQVSMRLAEGAGESAGAAELLRLHLANCPRCRALEAALARLERELPALAEAASEPEFVSAVLAATSGHRTTVVAVRRPVVTGFWERLVRRPRLALEGAYAVAMLALLVFGLPAWLASGDPLHSLDAWWRGRTEMTRQFIQSAGETARTGQADLGRWSASAAYALDSTAQVAWDRVIAGSSEKLWSRWNESGAEPVERDTTNQTSPQDRRRYP